MPRKENYCSESKHPDIINLCIVGRLLSSIVIPNQKTQTAHPQPERISEVMSHLESIDKMAGFTYVLLFPPRHRDLSQESWRTGPQGSVFRIQS